jgi:hypothetical protein
MTDEKRAIELHDLALSVVRAQGTPVVDGPVTVHEFRCGLLLIRYWPVQRALDVLWLRKVLTVERWLGDLQVIHYSPGIWEQQLHLAAAGVKRAHAAAT